MAPHKNYRQNCSRTHSTSTQSQATAPDAFRCSIDFAARSSRQQTHTHTRTPRGTLSASRAHTNTQAHYRHRRRPVRACGSCSHRMRARRDRRRFGRGGGSVRASPLARSRAADTRPSTMRPRMRIGRPECLLGHGARSAVDKRAGRARERGSTCDNVCECTCCVRASRVVLQAVRSLGAFRRDRARPAGFCVCVYNVHTTCVCVCVCVYAQFAARVAGEECL